MHKKKKKCQVTRRKELFYYVTSGSNVTRDVHRCVTVFYQQIENGNIANQIHGFTIDYGKFILIIAFVKERFHNAVEIDILGIFEGYSSLQICPSPKNFQGRNYSGRMT